MPLPLTRNHFKSAATWELAFPYFFFFFSSFISVAQSLLCLPSVISLSMDSYFIHLTVISRPSIHN